MSNPSYTIIVGIDFEQSGNMAFDSAVRLAGGNPNSELHVLYVDRELVPKSAKEDADASGLGHQTTRTESQLDRVEKVCRERLDEAMKNDPKLSFRRVVTHFRLGKPAEELVQLAVDLDADLIVVGTHNRKGLKRIVLGSVAEKVVHTASCPVYVVRPKDHSALGDVPEIEPPCPKCLATRAESDGADLWCAQHKLAKYHPRPHRYSYSFSAQQGMTTTDTTGSPTIN